MRKSLLTALVLVLSLCSFAGNLEKMGTIYEEDFRKVGVSEEHIVEAKKKILEASKNHQLLMLERKKLELEVNQYMLIGPDKEWENISLIFDKMGELEAEVMKNKLKSQIEVRRYITQEQYEQARNNALKRLKENKK